MRNFLIISALLLTAQGVSASTPRAWDHLQRKAERSCIAASEFKRPRVSNAIIYDDSVGMIALLVTGTFPQAHMKGAAGTNLCLYNRLTKKAVVQEAKGWAERPY